ncbi:fungal trichothecene efflux pump [Aspergillus cavernicola]|uniref:Fungal trichothecene efflux pump n=1 Tax=Aspergillus cavernicola TaxID=176166 RepID=A0ABR4J2W9_9EURO
MSAKADRDTIHLEDGIASADPNPDSMKGDLMANNDRAQEARGRDFSQVPKSYWISPSFIGTYSAMGLTFMGTVGGFALFAPVISDVNQDLGPSENIVYAPLINVLLSAVTIQIIGSLSDIFGRRWFFIVGSGLGLIGGILGATAQSITQIIVSQAFFGMSKGFGISFFWVIGELVPMRWRFLAASGQYIYSFPGNPLAAKVALAFQTTTVVHWRGIFYLLIATNGLAMLCWFLFYHPPSFKMLHRRQLFKDLVLNFDWIGLFLYSGGLALVVLGLTWGGDMYPWDSAEVLGTVIGGVVSLTLFGLWEVYNPLPNVEPFIPVYLWKNIAFQSSAWLTGIGAATYYGFSLIWPDAVSVLYPGLSNDRRSTLSTVLILLFVLGQLSGGIIAKFTGARRGAILTAFAATPLLAAAGTNPLNLNLTIALVSTGCFAIGATEGVALVTSTFPLRTQEEIGTAGGLCGTIRQFLASVATAVFSTTLRNRLQTTTPQYMDQAARDVGLPASSVSLLVSVLGDSRPLNGETVPGLQQSMVGTLEHAWRIAHSEAYRTVIYVSLIFVGSALFLCWFVPDLDEKTVDYVAGHIHQASETRRLEEEEEEEEEDDVETQGEPQKQNQ